VKSTLKRKLKVLEIVKRETNETGLINANTYLNPE